MMRRAFMAVVAVIAVIGLLVEFPPIDEEPVPFTGSSVVEHQPYQNAREAFFKRIRRPVRLTIPNIDVSANVKPVGLIDQSTMEVPKNIRVVGWFSYSSIPGRYGTTVLVGHLDGARNPNGVFRRLEELKPGLRIAVTDAMGTRWSYEVRRVRTISRTTFAERAPFIYDYVGKERLVLLTCGGIYDSTQGGYQSTTVVTALPI